MHFKKTNAAHRSVQIVEKSPHVAFRDHPPHHVEMRQVALLSVD